MMNGGYGLERVTAVFYLGLLLVACFGVEPARLSQRRQPGRRPSLLLVLPGRRGSKLAVLALL